MPKVDANSVGLAYSRETTAGTRVVTGLVNLQPNEISNFGATIATTAREPISNKLQRQKGVITDLDAAASFSSDLTMDAFLDFIEAACFARRRNEDVWRLESTGGVSTDGSEAFLVKGGILRPSTDVLAKWARVSTGNMRVTPLFWTEGYKIAGNNGLKVVSADITGHASNPVGLLVANGNFEVGDETTTTGKISLCGVRLTSQANLGFTKVGTGATLTCSNAAITQLKKLIYPGQTVHFGSPLTAGGAVARAVHTGFARVTSFPTAATVAFDRLPSGFATHTLASNATMDLLFGDFVANVASTDDNYLERSHTLELVHPNLLSGSADAYEYAKGARIASLALNFPLSSKATMDLSFIAQDVDTPAAVPGGRADAKDPVYTAAINTSDEIGRLRIVKADETGLDTDFKSITITINPQLSAEKVLGTLGTKYVNRGNFLVDVSAQAIFSTQIVSDAIRNNTTMSMDLIVGNDDGVISIDVPSQTLSGGNREYPTNQSVLINTTGQSFEDATLKNSINVSMFVVPLPV